MPEIVGRLRTPRLSAAPSSPVQGEMYYDTSTSKLYWWNGTSWIDATGGGGAGSTDLVYNGAYPANTPYTDGDIVIDNGVAYMCVRPTSAKPTPWAGSRGGQEFYGTTPPASPLDGDIWILPADTTKGVNWKFRYRAGSSSAYKWEFIGGPPIAQKDGDQKGRTLAAIGDPQSGSVGPSITIPRLGEYLVEWHAPYFYIGGAPSQTANVYVSHSGGTISAPITQQGAPVGYSPQAGTVQITVTVTGVMKAQYNSDGTYPAYWNTPELRILPVRVS